MPRGQPRKVQEVKAPPQWEAKVVASDVPGNEVNEKMALSQSEKRSKQIMDEVMDNPQKIASTGNYSCGCKFIPVDATRNKKKCPKHGVE